MKPVRLVFIARRAFVTSRNTRHVRASGYGAYEESFAEFFSYLCNWAEEVDRKRDETDRNPPAP